MDFRRYENAVNAAFHRQIQEFKLMERQDYLELFSIAIHSQWRGQGLGSAIIEDLIEFAREQKKYKGIQLQVDHKTKAKLVPFYESFGFVSIDDEIMDFMRIYFDEG